MGGCEMGGVCVNGVSAVCVRDALKWHVRWVRWVGVCVL